MRTQIADVREEIRGLREALGLSQEELARLLGVSVRTVSRWESCAGRPNPLAWREIRRWQAVTERLREVFRPAAVPRWFHSPNQALGGKTPWEVACAPGGGEELLDLLGRIEWGIPG